eukprot:1095530-Pleurochrysis_carterae.AAC.1
MVSPASTHATEMFTGDARHAAAELLRPTRAAKRVAGTLRGSDTSSAPKLIDWKSLSASTWKRYGAMSIVRTKGNGMTLVFTAGRDVAREAVIEGENEIMVQLMEIEEEVMPLAADQLLMSSDGVLAGVLTINQRKSAAAPNLQMGPPSCVDLTVQRQATVAGGCTLHPQGRPAGAPFARLRHGRARLAVGAAASTARGAGAARCAVKGNNEADGVCFVAGRCAGAGTAGAAPCDVAQFAAPAARDVSVVYAVEAGVVAALAADEDEEVRRARDAHAWQRPAWRAWWRSELCLTRRARME